MGRRPSATTIYALRTTMERIENAPDLAPDAPLTELKRDLLRRIVALDSRPESPDQIASAPDDV